MTLTSLNHMTLTSHNQMAEPIQCPAGAGYMEASGTSIPSVTWHVRTVVGLMHWLLCFWLWQTPDRSDLRKEGLVLTQSSRKSHAVSLQVISAMTSTDISVTGKCNPTKNVCTLRRGYTYGFLSNVPRNRHPCLPHRSDIVNFVYLANIINNKPPPEKDSQ